MPIISSNALKDRPAPPVKSGVSRIKLVAHWLTNLVARFNIFSRFHPCMIGDLEEVDTVKRVALVRLPLAEQWVKFRFDKSHQHSLLANLSNTVEIHGKIEIDRDDNPIAVWSFTKIDSVDTTDIDFAEVLPDFLELTDITLPKINVDIDETKRFYSAELRDLNIFACGLSREHLKEQLRESIEVCWDEFVSEDSSDLSADAWDLRENLLSSFREEKRCYSNEGQLIEVL